MLKDIVDGAFEENCFIIYLKDDVDDVIASEAGWQRRSHYDP
jgi:hypothetical protein